MTPWMDRSPDSGSLSLSLSPHKTRWFTSFLLSEIAFQQTVHCVCAYFCTFLYLERVTRSIYLAQWANVALKWLKWRENQRLVWLFIKRLSFTLCMPCTVHSVIDWQRSPLNKLNINRSAHFSYPTNSHFWRKFHGSIHFSFYRKKTMLIFGAMIRRPCSSAVDSLKTDADWWVFIFLSSGTIDTTYSLFPVCSSLSSRTISDKK